MRTFQPDEATMRASLPSLRGYTLLAGIGHWPQLEAAEAVNRAPVEFLAQSSGR